MKTPEHQETIIKQAFIQATYRPDSDLSEDIWVTVMQKANAKTKNRFWIFSLISVASFSGTLYAFIITRAVFAQSGFYEYISLAFSNTGTIATYWQDFVLTLTDSIPIWNIAISLTLVFIFIIAFRQTMRHTGKNRFALSI